MEHVKRVAIFAVVFALLGVVGGSWWAAQFLPWYNSPGTAQAMCMCADLAKQVTQGVLNLQASGGIGGAVLGVVAGIVFTLWRRSKAKAAAAAAPTPPPAAA